MKLKSFCFLIFLMGVHGRLVSRRPWSNGVASSLEEIGVNNASHVPPNGFIAYGRQVRIGEFPWMTFVLTRSYGGQYPYTQCGGSLISDRHVLTAAHCVANARFLKDVTMIVGEYDTSTFPEDCDGNRCTMNHRTHPARITWHQNYEPNTLSNDIAMLRLAAQVNTDVIRPISLPPFDIDNANYENAPLTVAGWGRTEFDNLPNILRSTEVNLKTRQQCYRIYYMQYSEGHLCAGEPVTRTNSCQGDSGGPLMMYYGDKFYVSGLVSFSWNGLQCGASKATYYTNVFKYMQWINWAMRQ